MSTNQDQNDQIKIEKVPVQTVIKTPAFTSADDTPPAPPAELVTDDQKEFKKNEK